ncbi:ShlB/FhaC/HecB family hemolysin secretion/activation protein [Blastomonas sp.]|uniref:ShlB/FhaC/HecB family hemolysin secretion/activation protein n=1 Tax=Blastomonas sp. TaxID=1909299 RepID=UPI0026337739|nr:ShlB/FhaC/HecB family hemolysin secretion/activation protein [Blastomonas sp.]MDM7955898.1 ShlB/FhaC/HecB family hemolysin secretion/activation protein [Blastomonas sp.]
MNFVLMLALQAAQPVTHPVAPPCEPAPMSAESGIVSFCSVEVRADEAVTAIATADSDGLDFGGFAVRYRKGDRLDAEWVRQQVAANGLLGAPVPLDRIAAVVQQISLAYVRNGFVNSGVLIDPVTDATGHGSALVLRLVAGGLAPGGAAVEWQDGHSRGLSEAYVLGRMPSIRRLPLNGLAIERDFRGLAADDAIATVKADLQPGTQPGEARLSLLVDPAPRFAVQASIANSRSPAVGGLRFGTGFSVRNALMPGDRIALDAGLTAGRPDILADYAAPFIDPAMTLDLRAGYNRAAVVDAPLRNLNIRARDWFVEGGFGLTVWQRPLTPASSDGQAEASAQAVMLRAGIIHRETRTFLLGQPFSFSPGSVRGLAEYTALRLGADWTRRSSATVWIAQVRFTQGLEGSRSDVIGIAAPSPNFRSWTGQISHARRLGRSGFELRARLAGQYGEGALYAGERFVAGGSQSVRGYRESLLLADRGVTGSVELARPLVLGTGAKGALGLRWGTFTPAVFADGAVVRNADRAFQPVPGEIASIGAQLSWTPSPQLSARLTYGHALIDAPVSGDRDLQDDGLSFALAWNLRF